MIVELFLALLAISIAPAEAQTADTTAVSVTIDTLQQNTCFCNLYSNLCDIGCCCDPDCDSSAIAYFKTYKLCKSSSRTYYSLPYCDDGYTYAASDLQLGLNLYYYLAKRLLCVYGNRTSSISITDNGASAEEVAEAEQRTAIQPTNLTAQGGATYIYRASTINGQTAYQRWAVPRQGYFSNVCEDTPVNIHQRLDYKPCKRIVTQQLADWCVAGTFADPAQYTGLVFRNGISGTEVTNLQLRNIYINSFDGKAYTTTNTLPAISSSSAGTTCTCNYPIVEAHYYIQSTNSTPGAIQDAYVDVVVASKIEGTCDVNFAFTQAFTVTFYQTSAPNLRKTPLYFLGEPLRFGTKVSGTGVNGTVEAIRVSDYPISLNLVDKEGLCFEEGSTTQTLNYEADPSTLTLGDNAAFTCSVTKDLATLQTYCSSGNMYKLLQFLNVVDYVHYFGYFANADPLKISDWFAATNTLNRTTLPTAAWDNAAGTCTFAWPYINIYYSKMGVETNPGYKLNYVEVLQRSDTFKYTLQSGSQSFTHTLYVNYIPLNQTAEFYKSPAPKGKIYFPNDVMYPLYIASGSKVQVILEIIGVFVFIVFAKVF